MPTSTRTRNNHWSYFSQHRLVLPILEQHINGITQCVIFVCMASFAQHSICEINPCFFEYQCFLSFYCPVILHCMHILQLVHSLQSCLTGFFLQYLKSAPLAIPVAQSSSTTWIWPLLSHAATQLVLAIISSFLISLSASLPSVYFLQQPEWLS